MKTFFFLSTMCFAFVLHATYAQVSSRDGFQLNLQAPSVSLMRGTSDSVSISVIRAPYKRGNAVFSLSSPKTSGIDIKIQPVLNKPDNYILCIAVDERTQPGEYTIIPSCTIQNKIKGAVFKIIVN